MSEENINNIKELQQKSVIDANSIIEAVATALDEYKISADVKEVVVKVFMEHYNIKDIKTYEELRNKHKVEREERIKKFEESKKKNKAIDLWENKEKRKLSEENINNYVEDLKKLIELKFKIQIPQSWYNPLLLETFCGCNDLRKEQEEIWKNYLQKL